MKRAGLPVPPAALADEVELYAREHGRTGRLVSAPNIIIGARLRDVIWIAEFSLRPNDKRLLAYQEGRAPEPAVERVWFVEPNPKAGQVIPNSGGVREPPNRPLNIEAMGASGIRTFLERGNTWSGRGEYDSIVDQRRQVNAANEAARQKHRADQKDLNRERQKAKRRTRFKIPFLSVSLPWRKTDDTPTQRRVTPSR